MERARRARGAVRRMRAGGHGRRGALGGRLGIALGIGIAFGLAACTNDPYPAEDAHEKVLYLAFDDPPKTLDPAVAYTTSAHQITGKVCDTLLEYHYLKRPYELIPGLATHEPEAVIGADGTVSYAFELRDDLWFQDDPCFSLSGGKSRRIGADDFAFELMRIGDPAVNSPVIEPFSNLVGFREFPDKLTAARKDRAFAALPVQEQYARVGGIAGVKVQDRRHFTIVLERAYPQILYWFAMPFTTPVPWEAVKYYDGKHGRPFLADHPVSSGPYLLSTYDKQAKMVLEKNPNWYGIRHPEWHAEAAVYPSEGEPDDAAKGRLDPKYVGKPLPFVSRIEFRREKEAIPAFNKFLEGYYDASGIIKESFDKVVREDRLSPEMQAMGMQLDKSVEPAIYYIGFNMDDPVVGAKGGERSRKLRQAMSLVVDSKEYCRLFMNGRGVPAQSVVAPGIYGYDPTYRNPFRAVDPARARALLAEAGYEGGIDPATHAPLKLSFDTSDTSADGRVRYEFFVNEWRSIGLNVEIAATSYNKFQQKIADGAYQIFMWGWVADYPDPENFMFLLWSDMARTKNQGPNTANYANPEFDKLFFAMKTRDNDAERLAIIGKMNGILERDRPWIELFYPEAYSLYQSWIVNVKPVGLSAPTAKYYDVDPVRRAELRKEWNRPILWPAYALAALLLAVLAPGVRTFMKERQ